MHHHVLTLYVLYICFCHNNKGVFERLPGRDSTSNINTSQTQYKSRIETDNWGELLDQRILMSPALLVPSVIIELLSQPCDQSELSELHTAIFTAAQQIRPILLQNSEFMQSLTTVCVVVNDMLL